MKFYAAIRINLYLLREKKGARIKQMGLESFSMMLLFLTGVVFCLYYIILFQYRPRLILAIFLLFILMQWLLVNRVGGRATLIGQVITYIDEGVINLLSIAVFLDTLNRRRPVYLMSVIAGLGIIVITGTIGSLIGWTPPLIVISDMLIYLKGFMVFYIFAYFYYPEEKLRTQVRFFGAIGILILFLGVMELSNPVGFRALTGNVMKIDWRVGIPSVQSIFIHPGLFGWFCGYIALFAFAFYLHKRSRSLMFLFVFFVLGVLVSMRLRVIAALAVAVVSGLWIYASRAKVKLIGLIGIVATVILLLFRTQITGIIREQIEEYKNPLKPRNVLYKTGITIAEKHFPFGVGFGRFGGEVAARYYSPVYYRYKFERIHGLWPEGRFLRDTFWPMILGELGVIGFIAYGGVLLFLFRTLLKSYRSADSPFLQAFTLGVCLVFIEGVVESLAEPVFTKPPACYFLFAVMGISYSLSLNPARKGFRSGNPKHK